MEYKGEPEGTAEATGERVGEGSNVPGHNHELEVDGIRIGIIGCPGCMAEERVILSSIDFTVPLYPWKGPTTEEWVRRIGGDVPWVR